MIFNTPYNDTPLNSNYTTSSTSTSTALYTNWVELNYAPVAEEAPKLKTIAPKPSRIRPCLCRPGIVTARAPIRLDGRGYL